MRIGLCGAHRTGKSTLAAMAAKRLNIKHIASPVSEIAKSYNFNMDEDRRDAPHFFTMQKHILVAIAESVKDEASFVSDRTPLDAAAYLFADVQANTGDADWQEQVLNYQAKAIAATHNLFDAVLLVPPAIPFDPMDGKPGGNLAYQEHHHLICAGLVGELSIPCAQLPRELVSLQERVNAVVEMAGMVREARAAKSGLVGI